MQISNFPGKYWSLLRWLSRFILHCYLPRVLTTLLLDEVVVPLMIQIFLCLVCVEWHAFDLIGLFMVDNAVGHLFTDGLSVSWMSSDTRGLLSLWLESDKGIWIKWSFTKKWEVFYTGHNTASSPKVWRRSRSWASNLLLEKGCEGHLTQWGHTASLKEKGKGVERMGDRQWHHLFPLA